MKTPRVHPKTDLTGSPPQSHALATRRRHSWFSHLQSGQGELSKSKLALYYSIAIIVRVPSNSSRSRAINVTGTRASAFTGWGCEVWPKCISDTSVCVCARVRGFVHRIKYDDGWEMEGRDVEEEGEKVWFFMSSCEREIICLKKIGKWLCGGSGVCNIDRVTLFSFVAGVVVEYWLD